jgi:light-harvesting complex 1 beta chain
MSENKLGPGTYLTDAEAKEVHKLFVASTAFFVLVAVVAHFLVWTWRPWLGEPKALGVAAIEQIQQADASPAARPTAG